MIKVQDQCAETMNPSLRDLCLKEKTIPSLRYLCLEKVIEQNEGYEDLPEILIKDINLMKVFNGTYSLGGLWETIEMKIFYDGKVWKFKSRTFYHESDGEAEDGKWVCFCSTAGIRLVLTQ